MWKQVEEARKKELSRKRKIQSCKAWSCSGIVLFILFVIVHTIGWERYRGYLSPKPLGESILLAIIESIIILLLFKFIYFREDNSIWLLCPNCDAIKNDDGRYQCQCGGRFQPRDDFEWIDDPNE